MSEQSIRKLKKRIIFSTMVSFMIVMLLMGSFIFCFNVVLTRAEIRRVLDYIARNDGMVPESAPHAVPGSGGRFQNPIFHLGDDEELDLSDVQSLLEGLFQIGRGYDTPEYFYMMRYFAVLYDEADAVEEVVVNHISSVDRATAIELANEARRGWFRFGSYGDYYYLDEARTEGGRIVIYLNSTNQIFMNNRLLYIALLFLVMGSLCTYFIMRALSAQLVKPELRNAELQKQFLTNASHELKTPLAVIRANTELLEMTGGENEWTQATLRQVDRLQGLVENLVMITRAQERDAAQDRQEMDVARPVRETAETFQSVAAQEGKTVSLKVPEELRAVAAESEIRQLTSLLVDNAIKYCDPEGQIEVELQRTGRRGRGFKLSVSNSFAEGKDVDYERFFERFYRADESHNLEKGGYGIGLSIAEQIVKSYRGEIRVSWEAGRIAFVCSMAS